MDMKDTPFPNLPERIIGLEEMAENLWWSWHPEARMLAPLYYKTSQEGIPTDWMKVMKEAIRSVAPRFCASYMAKEYVQKFYVKAFRKA